MLKECVEQHQLTLDENHARDFIDTMLIEINKTTGIKIICLNLICIKHSNLLIHMIRNFPNCKG